MTQDTHLSRIKENVMLPLLYQKVAAKTEGFSGAEIEQAIVAGLYLSREQQQPLDTGHLATEIRQTRPLSQVMAEKIDRLRAWARERTVAAD